MENINDQFQNNVILNKGSINILNKSYDVMRENSFAVNNSVSSRLNEFFLLDQSFFIVEYTVTTGNNTNLILKANWFLQMLNSFSLSLGTIQYQSSAAVPQRAYSDLCNINKLKFSNFEEFAQFSNITDGNLIMNDYDGVAANYDDFNMNQIVKNTGTKFLAAQKTYQNYVMIKLSDFIPLVSTNSTFSGNIIFNMNFSFNNNLFTGTAPTSFIISKLNFHYTMGQVSNINSDFLLNSYSKTLNVIQGKISKSYNINMAIGDHPAGSLIVNVFSNDLQLTSNQIKYIYICPIFKANAGANATLEFPSKMNGVPDTATAFTTAEINKEFTTDHNQIGLKYFGVKNYKCILNGVSILPSTNLQQYQNGKMAEIQNYLNSFCENSFDQMVNNSVLSYNIYKNLPFKPLIFDLSNATQNSSLTQCTVQFDVYNLYEMTVAVAGIDISIDFSYYILNEIEIGNV